MGRVGAPPRESVGSDRPVTPISLGCWHPVGLLELAGSSQGFARHHRKALCAITQRRMFARRSTSLMIGPKGLVSGMFARPAR